MPLRRRSKVPPGRKRRLPCERIDLSADWLDALSFHRANQYIDQNWVELQCAEIGCPLSTPSKFFSIVSPREGIAN